MFFYYSIGGNNILMRLREDDRWYLVADQDAAGVATLYINAEGKEYPLMSRRDLCGEGNNMDDEEALDYFNRMIRCAFQMVRNGKKYIDFDDIEFTVDWECAAESV